MPVIIAEKEECFGCTACFAICPTNAIQMAADQNMVFNWGTDYSRYTC